MTKQTRRRFTSEYKEQAVARLSEDGVTYASLAGELGVTNSQLKSRHFELLAANAARLTMKVILTATIELNLKLAKGERPGLVPA